MSAIVAIGSSPVLDGLALTGVVVMKVSTPDEAGYAWDHLEAGVGLLVVDAMAADALAPRFHERPSLLIAGGP